MPSINNIPVITYARASPFFSLNLKAHWCLTSIHYCPQESDIHKQNSEISNLKAIFHQNIRGLRNKSDELLHSFEIDATSPHVLCLSEHRMVEQDLLHLSVNDYQLESSFCRRRLWKGGWGVTLLKKDLYCNKIDISQFCTIQLVTKAVNLHIIGIMFV
jgi:hypothetical protein